MAAAPRTLAPTAAFLPESDFSPSTPNRILVHDETLRDGLQSPSAIQPPIGQQLELLHLMHQIGVDSACLGMPITSSRAAADVAALASEVVRHHLPLQISCAARTVQTDIAAVADIAQRTGADMWVMAFVGISPIRFYVEDWRLTDILRAVQDCVAFARREGLRVCLVTEDTTRAWPQVTLAAYRAAVEAGAERICVCDTVGSATPALAAAVVQRLRDGLTAGGHHGVGIDWHGHNDRGLALANALAAAAAGADRLHATALGIGERTGNTAMEQLLANLHETGVRSGDLAALPRYCDAASRACQIPIPANQPLVGSDAYRTASGVHAAAIRKAEQCGEHLLAEHVYAGIPADLVGRAQQIDVGPCSGRANVLHWLQAHGVDASDDLVSAICREATAGDHVLADDEIARIVFRARATTAATPALAEAVA